MRIYGYILKPKALSVKRFLIWIFIPFIFRLSLGPCLLFLRLGTKGSHTEPRLPAFGKIYRKGQEGQESVHSFILCTTDA